MPRAATPGRLRGRLGVLRCAALTGATLALLLPLQGCEAVGGGETLELDTTTVRLDPGASIREVHVGGAGARDSIAPDSVTASPGDVVRFTVHDHRTHALAFNAAELSDSAQAFLEQTQQLRGPPLINEGSAWVVSLQDAPPSRYPFFCRSHDAGGVLVVQ